MSRSCFLKGGEKNQKEIKSKSIDRTEGRRVAYTCLICMFVLGINLKQQRDGQEDEKKNKCQGSSKINKRTKRSEIQNKQLHSKTSEERQENTQKLGNTKIHTYIQEPKQEEGRTLFLVRTS